MKYAQGTSVSADRSIADLRSVVQRFGADGFGYAEESSPPRAMILFRIGARGVRLVLPFPEQSDPLFNMTPAGRPRSPAQAEQAFQDERRRRWRALLLVVKAKLEAVSSQISTLEREFLADLVLPNGKVVHEEIAPRLEQWASGSKVPLIPERLT